MPLHHGWGWYPAQTASHILIRHIKCVWAIGMLSQGHMGAPLYHYTSKVGLRLWNLAHLCCENDAIMWWLRLTSTSDCFSNPYKTYTKCLRYYFAVSRAYWCTLIPLHRISWPHILKFLVHLWSENEDITSSLKLISALDWFTHPYQTCKTCLSYCYAVSQAYGSALIPLYRPSQPKIKDLWVICEGQQQ